MSTDASFDPPPLEGPSIAAFCREHRLPQRRVLRAVKRAATRALSPEARQARDAGKTWRVDLTDDLGVAAWQAAGGTRTRYAVTDANRLFHKMTGRFGADLLTRKQLARIVRAARLHYRNAMDENDDYVLVRRDNSRKIFSPKRDWYEYLDDALRRLGE